MLSKVNRSIFCFFFHFNIFIDDVGCFEELERVFFLLRTSLEHFGIEESSVQNFTQQPCDIEKCRNFQEDD
jgi:hypothetical protein